MKVILSGGGTAGHITPLLAVARELKKISPDISLIYIGEKNGKFAHLIKDSGLIDEVYQISAGKFRRYHKASFLNKVSDIKTNWLNLVDFFKFLNGVIQARRLLKQIKPAVIFIKGGFVGVPVGLAAAQLKLPYITHDSDTLPGLANRLISRWASAFALGMPKQFYNYPEAKSHYVGIPIPDFYKFVDKNIKNDYRQSLKLPADSKIIFVTGGSLGAKRLNIFLKQILPTLLKNHPDLMVIHQTGEGGAGLYDDFEAEIKPKVVAQEFFSDMYLYSGAADLVISRAGATAIAELAAQAKATIIIPNPDLTGGHQLKNAQELNQNSAAVIIQESELKTNVDVLLENIENLLNNPKACENLSTNLHKLSKPQAATNLANLILSLARDHRAKNE